MSFVVQLSPRRMHSLPPPSPRPAQRREGLPRETTGSAWSGVERVGPHALWRFSGLPGEAERNARRRPCSTGARSAEGVGGASGAKQARPGKTPAKARPAREAQGRTGVEREARSKWSGPGVRARAVYQRRGAGGVSVPQLDRNLLPVPAKRPSMQRAFARAVHDYCFSGFLGP